MYIDGQSHSLLQLFHSVEGRACLEPFNLGFVEGVVQLNSFRASINVLDDGIKGLKEQQIKSIFSVMFVGSHILKIGSDLKNLLV